MNRHLTAAPTQAHTTSQHALRADADSIRPRCRRSSQTRRAWARPVHTMLTPGIVAVALAVLERRDHWLIQLRDDRSTIVAPGCWGLFGGHMESGETPEQSLRRELIEEIGYGGGRLTPWFRSAAGGRVRHVFRVSLDVEPEQLQLNEGQDMALASLEELSSGRVWSPRLAQHRPLAPSLQEALARQLRQRPGRSR